MTEGEFRKMVAGEGYPEVRAISSEPHRSADLHPGDAATAVLVGVRPA